MSLGVGDCFMCLGGRCWGVGFFCVFKRGVVIFFESMTKFLLSPISIKQLLPYCMLPKLATHPLTKHGHNMEHM